MRLQRDDVGAISLPGPLDGRFELGHRAHRLGAAAHRGRVGRKIHFDDVGVVGEVGAAVRHEVVERHPARGDLQPVDDGEAAVVAHDDDELVPRQHRAVEVAVHHQVRAVADQGDHLAVGHGHLRSPGPRDLIPHAGVAVLAVERMDALRAPPADQLAGESPRGGDHVGGRTGGPVDRSDDLRVGREVVGIGSVGAGCPQRHRGGDLVDVRVVLGRLRGGPHRPGLRGPVVADGRAQLGQTFPGVGHQRNRPVLDRVEAGRVQPDDAGGLVSEHGP